MTSKYHINVQKGIVEFGKEFKRFKEIYGENRPILINHPRGRFAPIRFFPDAQFVTKQGKRYLFEIMDSQLKNENLIIADVLLACLSANISKIVFIVPTEQAQGKVQRVAATIVANLESLGIPKKKLPKEVRFAFILKEEAKSPEAVRDVLRNMEFKLLKKLLS